MDDDKKLLQAYDIQTRHFQIVNDNFFKRVHVFMAAAEAALVAITVTTILRAIELKMSPPDVFVLLAAFSLGGIVLGMIWFVLGTRQMQAMELNRRYMRHLEQSAWTLGIPLGIHTFDAFVAHETKTATLPARFGIELRVRSQGQGQIKFGSEEVFPEVDSGPPRFRYWTVQAGVAPLETSVSFGFAVLWIEAAIISAKALFSHKEPLAAWGVIACLAACAPLAVGLLLAPRRSNVFAAAKWLLKFVLPWRWTRKCVKAFVKSLLALLLPWRWSWRTLKILLFIAGVGAFLCGTVFICLSVPLDWTYPP